MGIMQQFQNAKSNYSCHSTIFGHALILSVWIMQGHVKQIPRALYLSDLPWAYAGLLLNNIQMLKIGKIDKNSYFFKDLGMSFLSSFRTPYPLPLIHWKRNNYTIRKLRINILKLQLSSQWFSRKNHYWRYHCNKPN